MSYGVSIMSDWVELFEAMQQDYIDYLESEHGVTTASEYFEHIEVDLHNPEAFHAELRQSGFRLEHLFQCLPIVNQDVVVLSSNPALQDDMTVEIFHRDAEFGTNRKQTDDLEERAENLAKNLYHYLTRSNGFSKIIPRMQDGLSLLTPQDKVPFEEYVRPDEIALGAQNFFSEVYYSRIYKFPSDDEYDLTGDDVSFGKQTFRREFEHVSPKVTVATGKHAWNAIYEMVPDDQIVTHRNSHLTPKFWKYTRGQARGGVFEIPSRDLWVITTRHGSYDSDTERLKKNLNYVNERL